MTFFSWRMPLLLGVITFLVYLPSLRSDFVYDAQVEIMKEGFITSFSNVPAVLSLKVLSMNLMLGSRPVHLFYLMLIAAFFGKHPFGYHLCSNLLHATNVVLLFILLRRLIAPEMAISNRNAIFKVQFALLTAVFIFALHPIAVESVSEVSYSSSLLVTFFTLLSLITATAFRPDNPRSAVIFGSLGTLCAFAAVASKESGLAASLLLSVYWLLFRRQEAKLPWVLFLTGASVVTMTFLAARFLIAPVNSHPMNYLGGSFSNVFWIQPRIWVFMMGKLLWPISLSADYTGWDVNNLSILFALIILSTVVLAQGWLAFKSKIGALGIAIYWIGLIAVSNFIPLYRPIADRFYYLPLVGWVMQILAFLIILKSRNGFWIVEMPLLGVILPLTVLTLNRQQVFNNQFSLWSSTLQVSPFSAIAHNGLGLVLFQRKQIEEAIIQYRKALEINPIYSEAYNNLGVALLKKGREQEALLQFQKALELNPKDIDAYNNMGNVLCRRENMDKAIAQYQKALELDPNNLETHSDMASAFYQKGQFDDAIAQYRQSLQIDPNNVSVHNGLGNALLKKGEVNEAVKEYQAVLELGFKSAEVYNNLGNALSEMGQVEGALIQYRRALEIDPDNAEILNNFGNTLSDSGQISQALAEYQKAIQIDPNDSDVRNNLALVLMQTGQINKAIEQFEEVVRLNPNDSEAQSNLAKAKASLQHSPVFK